MKKRKIYADIFLWLFVGLLLTFGVGYSIALNETMIENIYGSNLWIIFAILEIVIAIFLQVRIHKWSKTTVTILYLAYCFLSAFTFSSIFIVYEVSSIIWVFFITSIIFLVFAIIGYKTKVDLSKISTFLFMGLLGIILVGILNIWLQSDTLTIILSCISIVIFIGYVAYDIQTIKRMDQGKILNDRNLAIYGAFQLYLDFINIFLDLLRIFGEND